MNHDNRDARFDAAMRQLHEVATERLSGRTRLQLQRHPRAAPARPALQRFGWPLGASFAAALALMAGLQLRHDPTPTSAPSASSASAATTVADNGDDIDAVLDENPDLYLWLASNDAYALAME